MSERDERHHRYTGLVCSQQIFCKQMFFGAQSRLCVPDTIVSIECECIISTFDACTGAHARTHTHTPAFPPLSILYTVHYVFIIGGMRRINRIAETLFYDQTRTHSFTHTDASPQLFSFRLLFLLFLLFYKFDPFAGARAHSITQSKVSLKTAK